MPPVRPAGAARSRSTASTCATLDLDVVAIAAHRGVPGLHPLRAAAARQRRAGAARPTRSCSAALDAAGAADLARLDTVLARGYDGGTDLSGGQWQRVALARALCAVRMGAGVVLLDEPTAQLDVRGEAEIFERLLAATRHCTTILISHRFSTVRHADRICVLEHGKVVELGTHDELMALGGRYRTMFDLQAQRFTPSEDEDGGGAMTSSSDAPDRSRRPLPPALPSMWRLCKLGYRHEPRLIVAAFVAGAARGAAGRAAGAVVQAARRGRARAATRTRATRRRSALGVSATATWFLRTVSTRVQRRFRDKVTIALESHVAPLLASIATIAHQERPDYLDRLVGAAQSGVRARPHVHVAVLDVRLDPAARRHDRAARLDSSGAGAAGALRAAAGAHLDVAAGASSARAQERGAQSSRLARHLFGLATTAAPGKEVRVTGIGERLIARAPRGLGALATARSPPRAGRSAVWHALAWAIFGAAYVGAVVFVASGLRRRAGRRAAGAGGRARASRPMSARRSARSASCAASGWTARSRLAWLEDYAASLACDGRPRRRRLDWQRASASSTSRSPIPGTDRLVLDDVTLDLPAGRGRRDRRRERRRQVDAREAAGEDVRADARAHPGRRRRPGAHGRRTDGASRLAGAFQDFFRFEFRARQTVGVGDLPRLDDEPAVVAAVDRAGADDVVARLPPGSIRSSGRPGRAASRCRFGQWQKLALARGFMRDRPLLLVLDEPTAALDAETEHALFERYAAPRVATVPDRPRGDGRITILVSHRFSHRADGRSDRRPGRRARRRDGHPRGADGAAAVSTRSSTAFRPPRIDEAHALGCLTRQGVPVFLWQYNMTDHRRRGMKRLRGAMVRVLGMFSRGRRAQAFAEEIESHLQMHIDDNVRSGMPRDQARREAILKLGGVESTKQAYFDRATLPVLDHLALDVRFAVRQLAKNPGFSLTATMMLALGFCASLAIFGFVDAALIKPLPYKNPGTLMHVTESTRADSPREPLVP